MLEPLFRNEYPIPPELEDFVKKLQEVPERKKAIEGGWMSWDSEMRRHALNLKACIIHLLESIGTTSDDLLAQTILRRLRTYVSSERKFTGLYASHLPKRERTTADIPDLDAYDDPRVDQAVISLAYEVLKTSMQDIGNKKLLRGGYNLVTRRLSNLGEQMTVTRESGNYVLSFIQTRAKNVFLNLIPKNQDGKIVL